MFFLSLVVETGPEYACQQDMNDEVIKCFQSFALIAGIFKANIQNYKTHIKAKVKKIRSQTIPWYYAQVFKFIYH